MASNNSNTAGTIAGVAGVASALYGKTLAEWAAGWAGNPLAASATQQMIGMAFESAMAAVSFYGVVSSMAGVLKGDPMSIISGAMSGFGLYSSLMALGVSSGVGLIIVGVAVVIGLILALIPGKPQDRGEDQNDKAAGQFNAATAPAWYANMPALGTAAAGIITFAGLSFSPNAPSFQDISVPITAQSPAVSAGTYSYSPALGVDKVVTVTPSNTKDIYGRSTEIIDVVGLSAYHNATTGASPTTYIPLLNVNKGIVSPNLHAVALVNAQGRGLRDVLHSSDPRIQAGYLKDVSGLSKDVMTQ